MAIFPAFTCMDSCEDAAASYRTIDQIPNNIGVPTCPLLSTGGVRKKQNNDTVCCLSNAQTLQGGGGGFPHKSVPISGQTGREGRRCWGRHGEGEAEDEERGTKWGGGGSFGAISLLFNEA